MRNYFSKNWILSLAAGAALSLSGCAAGGPYLKMDSSLQKDIRTFDGIQYIPLVKLCERYKLRCDWDTFTRVARLEKNGKYITLRAGSNKILANGNDRALERPVLARDNAVFVPVSFVKYNLRDLVGEMALERVHEKEVSKRFSIKTIVIDAGHGGKDPGAIGRRFKKEKHLTLAISKKLKDILEGRGLKVIMTRDSDTFVSLPRRVEIANKSAADLFVSIHINASRTRSLKGFECYYLSNTADDNARALQAAENATLKLEEAHSAPADSSGLKATLWDMVLSETRAESADLASHICRNVEGSDTVENRGVRSARFYVLKGARMPAVLVEVAYISNRAEEMKLRDGAFLDKVTDAVAKGIMAYKREYEETEGYTKI